MTKDRMLFLFAFAFIGILAVALFSRNTKPQEDQAPVKVEKIEQESAKPKPLLPEPGKVAVPFLLTTRSSMVQFLDIGMFVDMIFTSKPDIGLGSVTLTLLNNVRVLGIGRDAEGKYFTDKASFYKPNAPLEILLEMTPRQAEILSYAEETGTVTIGIVGDHPVQDQDGLIEKLLESQSHESFQSVLVTHMVRSLFPDSTVKVIAIPKGYIVSGFVPNQNTSHKIVQILNLLTGEGGKTVVNLLSDYPRAFEILVAEQELKARDPLSLGGYKWVKIDEAKLDPSFIVRSPEAEKKISEAVLAKDVYSGQAIYRSDILLPDELQAIKEREFASLTVSYDKMAVPVEFSSRAPIAQMIGPGNFVDIRFTSRPDIGFAPLSFTLLSNLRVLSFGKDPEGKVFDGRAAFYKPEMPIEIFLEMTPKEAEIFSYAKQAGLITIEQTHLDCDSDNSELIEQLWTSESFGDFYSSLITHMIRLFFPRVCLKITAAPQGFIVEGKVPDPQMADKIMEILVNLIPGGNKAIVNLMDVSPQQVLLCVKVFEVAKGIRSRVGLNWEAIYQSGSQILAFGAVYPPPPASDPNYFLGAAGRFGRYSLSALIDMLERNGYAKILAEPNLTTISGETAHFFSGGEFPILIPQGGSLLGTVTVTFKKYGVLLDFTPVVDLNGLITMRVIPEVSNLDRENAVILSTFIIPSIVSRRVETTVKLWPGQSYLIAGLYLNELINQNDSLYGLNKIPLIGALFGSNRSEYRRTELLVIVTPYLINENNEVPTEGSPHPTLCPCESFSEEETTNCEEYKYLSLPERKTKKCSR